jgi:hypothetical protein
MSQHDRIKKIIQNSNIKNKSKNIINKSKESVLSNRNRVLLVLVTKNNSGTIGECLESVFDFVDGICIFDNESSDNTKEIIKDYFDDIKIPTKLSQLKGMQNDNGYNKTIAFKEAKKFCTDQKWKLDRTYCLFINPDEELDFPKNYNKEKFIYDSYRIVVEDGLYKSYQLKLIKMNIDWACEGKVNENWIINEKNNFYELDEDDFIILYNNDDSDEEHKSKLLKNIEILENDLKVNNNLKNIFDCADNYFELDNFEKAIELYEKRLDLVNKMGITDKQNYEDDFITKLRIAECKVALVYEEDDIRESYITIIDQYPFMLEPIYNLMYFYYVVEDWKSVFEIGKLGINIRSDNIPYKYEYKVYDYKYKKLMLDVCLKNKNYGLGVKLGRELLDEKLYREDEEDEDEDEDEEDKKHKKDEDKEEEEIKDDYKKCLSKLINSDLGLDEEIKNKDDIKIIIINENENENKNIKLLYNKILSCGFSVELFSTDTKIDIDNKSLKAEGWYNLNNNNEVSLFDKAIYHAHKNKYKYTWFITDDVKFNNDELGEKLKELLSYKSIDDLITTNLSEDNENMQKLLTENPMNTISKNDEDWMSTLNNICRISYSLLNRINEYRIKNQKMINNAFLFPTLCNKHDEMVISFFNELDIPVLVQKREKIELNEIENKVLNNPNTFYFNISMYCKYNTEVEKIKQYYTLNTINSTILDYDGFNQIKILIDKEIKLSVSDKKVIKGLERKNIIIHYENDNKDYTLTYKKNNYVCISMLLKDIIEKIAHSTQRLQFLENLLEGEEIVILGGGPSTAMLTDNELKYVIDNYITISVKYVIDILNKKKLHPTFHVLNQYLSVGSLEKSIEKSSKYTTIFGSDGTYENDTALMIVKIRDEHFCIRNFKKLLANHIDCLTWGKDVNNNRSYIHLHIMCELSLPLSIHLGIKKIYTTGWDLKPINNKNYCFESGEKHNKNSEKFEYKYVPDFETCEFNYVPDIEKILSNLGITINKINNSPILLTLKNDFFPDKY